MPAHKETSKKDGTSNRFREEVEIKACLLTHLNSWQIQAKSSNPPKVLTEQWLGNTAFQWQQYILRIRNQREYVEFQRGICLPLDPKKHQKIIFKALV